MDLSEMREELFKQDENNKNVILKNDLKTKPNKSIEK
jgi:hypothetical protein